MADLCATVEAEPGKRRKVELIGSFLRSLAKEEVKPAVLLLLGRILPEADRRSLDVGYRTVKRAVGTGQRTLFDQGEVGILDVESAFHRIASAKGPGSRKVKEDLLAGLLTRLDGREREYLLRSLWGEMRIGVNEGLLLEAVAYASGAPADAVRSANMLKGDVGGLASDLVLKGPDALRDVGMRLFTPIRPMLAEMSSGVEEALASLGRAAFEFKLDGARVQIHRDGEEVRVFSRRLTDITSSVPELVEVSRQRLGAERFIVEGEAVAYTDRPLPFQEVMRRVTRVHDIDGTAERVPLRLFLFDILLLGGRETIRAPYEERWELLRSITPSELLVPRLVTSDLEEARAFYERSLSEGHEGLVAKDLSSAYEVGKRGGHWLKVKRAHTLDLVILGADWGYGRREGWLSDYYLGARTEGGFAEVGKTFKGLTDEEFERMTARLLSLKVSEGKYTVRVRPEVVVEVAFDEVQRSPKYASGFALRLARIKSVREDKRTDEADTLDTVSRLFQEQFRTKAQLGPPE
ncbi:MAG: ATP-dependent DNA ligase [Methanomassiliicoccales archaeon]|nr:ATP-dependent DNA ligase [Methanomassiliicoccales archaeon]